MNTLRFRSILLKALIALVVLLLIVLAIVFRPYYFMDYTKLRLKHFCDKSPPIQYNPDWMSKVSNDTRLIDMSIPGTHDSCALYGTLFGRTQAWPIYTQLFAGIRYLDVRLRQYYDELQSYHGPMYQLQDFNTVFNSITKFLVEYPTETVILQLQDEWNAKNATGTFPEMITKKLSNKNISWVEFNPSLTIGECLGKVVIMPLDNKFKDCDVQNHWEITPGKYSVKDKMKSIAEHIEKSINTIDRTKMFVNFLSASNENLRVTPKYVALQVNSVPFKYNGVLGTLLMDFPSEKLIWHIIKQNLKE